MIISPSNLELLLHYFHSAQPHPRVDAPAIQSGIAYLLMEDMIVARGESFSGEPRRYQTTDKADAYIQHLLEIPFPEAKWVIPDGSE